MNHIRIGNQVHDLSKCIFNILEIFDHLSFSDYLLVTAHLPSTLVVSGSSNIDKMSSTHPNLIPSVVMSSMRQKEEMRKNIF